jgi:hypothetical protein
VSLTVQASLDDMTLDRFAGLPLLADKSSVTRDFSMHILYGRAKALRTADPEFIGSLGKLSWLHLLRSHGI